MKPTQFALWRTRMLGLAGSLIALSVSAQMTPSAAPTPPEETVAPAATGTWSGWTLGYSPYTVHYSEAKKEHAWEPDKEKHSYVWLIQAEKALDERHVAGFAYFSNSFGQPSQYGYYGWRFQPLDNAPQLFIKLTAGVIHGYKRPYDGKIPLNNRHGWGITAIPAVGYDFDRHWGAQVNVLGNAGLMFQLNYSVR